MQKKTDNFIFILYIYVTGHEKRYHLVLIIISEYSVK